MDYATDDWKVVDVTAIFRKKKRGGGVYNFVCVCAISSLKLTTESAWSELLSRRFHSIVVREKKSFCTGQCGTVGHVSIRH